MNIEEKAQENKEIMDKGLIAYEDFTEGTISDAKSTFVLGFLAGYKTYQKERADNIRYVPKTSISILQELGKNSQLYKPTTDIPKDTPQ